MTPTPTATATTVAACSAAPSAVPPGDLFVPAAPNGQASDPQTSYVQEYDAQTGAAVATFAEGGSNVNIDDGVALDAAGDVFVQFTGVGRVTAGYSAYAIGAQTATRDFYVAGGLDTYFSVAPNGELAVSTESLSTTSHTIDEWDPGASGSPNLPSRTISISTTSPALLQLALGPDGTLYVFVPGNPVKFLVYAHDSTTLERTIVDTLAPNATAFVPTVMTVAADGTLYVGEWANSTSDPDAGLYVYPATGNQARLTDLDAGIVGLRTDAAGNVYVASDNAVLSPQSTYGNDTAHQFSVFAPHGAGLVRQFDDGDPGVVGMTVGPTGTAYLLQASNSNTQSFTVIPNAPSTAHIDRIAAGTCSATVLTTGSYLGSQFSLYNGTVASD